MVRAFMFPGQGSQTVGMGREFHDVFPTARRVFEEVDEALREHLSRLIFEGPADDLILTQNAQPALMCVSLAALRALEGEAGKSTSELCAFVAGHSLGEYSALAAAGALSLADAARLLRTRGLAMQKAVPVGVGAMAALLGIELEAATEICAAVSEDKDFCVPANDNGGGQIVISGHKAAVERVMVTAKEKGVKRVLPLPVSAPFHCPLMQPAADAMAEALAEVRIAPLTVPLIANVTAAPVENHEAVAGLLVAQVTETVRWRETVNRLKAEGVERLVEIGAGKVLSGLARRIEKDLTVSAINLPADIDLFLKTL